MMHSSKDSAPSTRSNLFAVAALCVSIGTVPALLVAGAASLIGSGEVQAKPSYVKDTTLACTKCHTSAKGGADNLTPLGMEFQANGHKLPKK
jgi:hypothetical protein